MRTRSILLGSIRMYRQEPDWDCTLALDSEPALGRARETDWDCCTLEQALEPEPPKFLEQS